VVHGSYARTITSTTNCYDATTDVTKITTGLVETTFLSHEFDAMSRGPPPMGQTVRMEKINNLNHNMAHTQIRINGRKSCTRWSKTMRCYLRLCKRLEVYMRSASTALLTRLLELRLMKKWIHSTSRYTKPHTTLRIVSLLTIPETCIFSRSLRKASISTSWRCNNLTPQYLQRQSLCLPVRRYYGFYGRNNIRLVSAVSLAKSFTIVFSKNQQGRRFRTCSSWTNFTTLYSGSGWMLQVLSHPHQTLSNLHDT